MVRAKEREGGPRALLHHIPEAPGEHQLALARDDGHLDGEELPAQLGPGETVGEPRLHVAGKGALEKLFLAEIFLDAASRDGDLVGLDDGSRRRIGWRLASRALLRRLRDLEGPVRDRFGRRRHRSRGVRRGRRARSLRCRQGRHLSFPDGFPGDLPQYIGDLPLEIPHARLQGIAADEPQQRGFLKADVRPVQPVLLDLLCHEELLGDLFLFHLRVPEISITSILSRSG